MLNSTEPNESVIINKFVYYHANGTPLVDLEIQVCAVLEYKIFGSVMMLLLRNNYSQLPTSVCPYQHINYSIVVREDSPSEFSTTELRFGPFLHQGSGNIKFRVTAGLNGYTNYSVTVIVDTAVGSSETSTYFSKPCILNN